MISGTLVGLAFSKHFILQFFKSDFLKSVDAWIEDISDVDYWFTSSTRNWTQPDNPDNIC